ncbi:MAG: SDR family NAD(P)-dependent oxidoreductase [Candidatus Eremiobacteraeota bacterium]|nr:SDR family NAD(P)-dependent oxidoreductase [Candidatus Eremiobacteraeota bacterium]
MTGKTVLITGATSGIGLETARVLAGLGAHVVVGARDTTRGSSAVDGIRAQGGSAELLSLDVASLASVCRAAERFATAHERLDVLINNAGIIAGKRSLSPDGHELTWATNFLGLVALTRTASSARSRARRTSRQRELRSAYLRKDRVGRPRARTRL